MAPRESLPAPQRRAGSTGTQAIKRALALLRQVADHDGAGTRLGELANATGLSPATAHRILHALMEGGLVGRDPASRRYRLQSGYFALADAAARTDLHARLRPVLEQAARQFGESIYLSVRSGSEVLCIDRVTADTPIRVVPFDVGSRRPLGVGAAGIALLAEETPERAETIMRHHATAYAHYGLDVVTIARMVDACRRRGFSYNSGRFIRGVSGVGLAVRDATGRARAAVNVTALSPHLAKQADRRRIVAGLLALLSDADRDGAAGV